MWPQDSPSFAKRLPIIGDRTECQREDHRVKAFIGKLQSLGTWRPPEKNTLSKTEMSLSYLGASFSQIRRTRSVSDGAFDSVIQRAFRGPAHPSQPLAT